MPFEAKNFETLALHGGSCRSDPASGAVAVPIYQITSYQFQDANHASRLFALEQIGQIHTRIKNPSPDAFEERLAALESVGIEYPDDILADLALALVKAGAGVGVRKAA
jgi:O-acetylhomoserine (thiol)-lyase